MNDGSARTIEARALVKRFGRRTVLDGLDLGVDAGEIVAVLGRNGVGKTTLLRCLAGLYVPVAGTIRWGERDRFAEDLWWRRRTFWVDSEGTLPERFDGRSWLDCVAEIYGVSREGRDRRRDDLLRLLSLDGVADDRVWSWSKGQKKKLALAGAFLVAPELLLLDEPFAGEIDPPGIAAVQRVLRGLADAGSAMVLASQLGEQVTAVADRVALMARGRIVDQGPPAELLDRLGVRTLAEAVAATGSASTPDPDELVAELVAGRSPR